LIATPAGGGNLSGSVDIERSIAQRARGRVCGYS